MPIRYADAHERLLGTGAEGLVVVYDNQLGDTSVKNNIEIDDTGHVMLYEKDSSRELQYVEAGVLAFKKTCVDLIPSEGMVSLEKDIFPVLIKKRQLSPYITRQRFYDIGTPERLKLIEEFLAHDHHTNTISNSLRRRRIRSRTVLHPRARRRALHANQQQHLHSRKVA